MIAVQKLSDCDVFVFTCPDKYLLAFLPNCSRNMFRFIFFSKNLVVRIFKELIINLTQKIFENIYVTENTHTALNKLVGSIQTLCAFK